MEVLVEIFEKKNLWVRNLACVPVRFRNQKKWTKHSSDHRSPPRKSGMSTLGIEPDREGKATSPTVHLLPCNISFDGPAPISTYFQVAEAPDQSHYVSHFRGRRLIGTKLDLSAVQSTLVVGSVKSSTQDSAERSIETLDSADAVIAWGHDVSPSATFLETYSDWLEISQAVSSQIYDHEKSSTHILIITVYL